MLPRLFERFSPGLPPWLPGLPWLPVGRDELRIFLQPHKLSLLKFKRGIRTSPLLMEEYPLLPQPGQAAAYGEFWQPAVASLSQLLQQPQWQGCRPEVVISNHFAHYAIIPWNEGISSRDEQGGFVRHCFTQAYGDFARHWDLRFDTPRHGKPTLASAIDERLLQSLRLTFEQANMPVRHIHPHLMLAVNSMRRQLKRIPGLKALALESLIMVMLEDGKLIIALIEQGEWLSLQSYAAEADIDNQLLALLERESVLAGLDTSAWPVVFYAAETRPALQLAGRDIYNIQHNPLNNTPPLAEPLAATPTIHNPAMHKKEWH